MTHYLIMAYLKAQCICFKICFILGKFASGIHEISKTVFTDNLMQRTWTFEWFFLVQMCRNFPWRLWALRSSLHKAHRWKCGETLQNNEWWPVKYPFAMSERASLQKCLEWWWNQDCCVSATISGSWQNGCCPPLTWFGLLWFLRVSKNKIASISVLCSGCSQNSGTILSVLYIIQKSRFQQSHKPWRWQLWKEQQW
jgi:hypothetical protein